MSNKLDRPLGPTFSDGWLTCEHTSLTGGDDYQMCNHCGFEWDYRRETVAQALVREVVPYIAALRARLDERDQQITRWQEHFCIRCHHRWTTDATSVRSEYCGDCHRGFAVREKLLKRYLDNHCRIGDQMSTSALCECPLCLDTRKEIGL